MEKLKLMKKASLDWEKQKKASEEEALQQIEEELDQLENSEEDGQKQFKIGIESSCWNQIEGKSFSKRKNNGGLKAELFG